jgi:hypothetical protein
MTEHSAEEVQETEYAPALLKPGMIFGDDQRPPLNVIESPVVVTAMQKCEEVHEIEIRNFGPTLWLDVHLVPLNDRI